MRPWYQTQSFKSQAVGSTFGAFGKKGEKGKGKEKWQPPQQQKGGKNDTKGKKGAFDAGKGLSKGKSKAQYPADGKGPQPTTAQTFQGYCNHCGKWGHKLKECRSVHVVESEQPLELGLGTSTLSKKSLSTLPPSASEDGRQGVHTVEHCPSAEWIFAVDELRRELISDNEIALLSLDSGAYDHVCPPDFCSWCELRPVDVVREVAAAADGSVMKQFGERTLTFGLIEDGCVTVSFQVLNVAKPIHSVSKLVAKDFSLALESRHSS